MGGWQISIHNKLQFADKFNSCMKTQWFLDSIESPPIIDHQIIVLFEFALMSPK